MSDNPFHAASWSPADGFGDLTDITYHRHITGLTVRVVSVAHRRRAISRA
jgi:naphthoate synthase